MTAITRRATAIARRRHRKHGNPFGIRGDIVVPEWPAVFGRQAPLALDVGFGEGNFLLELGAKHPEWNVLGLEIRIHLVEEAIAQAKLRGLPNVHAVLANANEHMGSLVPDASVAFVAVNFPDPWFKQRHRKRRVVRADFLDALTPKLQNGAELHAMSDFQPIAEQIRKVVEVYPGFTNLDGPGAFAPESTTGIVTEREIKHSGRGEPIHRMRFRYTR